MNKLLFAAISMSSLQLLGQVGIGTSAPDASAVLEVQSTQKGLLIPRMSSTDRDAIASPATGLLIFNSSTGTFQFYTGTGWSSIGLTSVSNADVAANAAIAFSKLDISQSDIQGLGAYSDYTAGSGLNLNNSEFSIDNTVVTSNYSGSVDIAGTLNSGGTGHSSAILAATSTSKGFLPPRMTAAQRALISGPTEGLLVYQTDGIEGLYAFDGSNWLHNSQWYANTATTPSVFNLSKPANIDATGASANIGIGSGSLSGLTTGDNNVALGVNALNDVITNGNSTAIGYGSLSATTGIGNTAIGYTSGSTNVSGSNNTFIGNQANSSTTGLSNATAIGNGAEVTTSNTIQLGNGSVTNVNTAGGITAGGSVGIGTTSPNSNAALDISSTSKGFLPPRLTQTQINSINPTIGLVAYNLTTNNLQVCKPGSESLDVNNNNFNQTSAAPYGIYQSFTAAATGLFSGIEVYIRNPATDGSAQVYCELYSGATTSGTAIARSDTITATSASSYNWDKLSFNSANLVEVSANDILTFKIIPLGSTSNFTWVGTTGYSSYSDGQAGSAQSGFFSNIDLGFKTYVKNASWTNL
jgi:hypothetical protein